MKSTGEADRQGTAAQGPLQHPHQVEMTEQSHGPCLGKTDPQPADPLTGGRLAWQLRWHHRGRHHHVVAKVRPTNATAAATVKGAVRHHRRRQSPLQILRQPTFVDAGVDVIPGQRLSAEAVEVLPIQGRHRTPTTHLHLAVTPLKASCSDGTGPGGIGAIEGFKPCIHPRTRTPGGLDHRGHASIAATHKILHRRQPHVGEIHLQPAQAFEGPAQ